MPQDKPPYKHVKRPGFSSLQRWISRDRCGPQLLWGPEVSDCPLAPGESPLHQLWRRGKHVMKHGETRWYCIFQIFIKNDNNDGKQWEEIIWNYPLLWKEQVILHHSRTQGPFLTWMGPNPKLALPDHIAAVDHTRCHCRVSACSLGKARQLQRSKGWTCSCSCYLLIFFV